MSLEKVLMSLRSIVTLILCPAFFLASGCDRKSKQPDELEKAKDIPVALRQTNEEAQQIIDRRADLRERIRENARARKAKQEFLKAHPELLAAPVEPDPARRPTAPVPSNLPPQMYGAALPPTNAALPAQGAKVTQTAKAPSTQ